MSDGGSDDILTLTPVWIDDALYAKCVAHVHLNLRGDVLRTDSTFELDIAINELPSLEPTAKAAALMVAFQNRIHHHLQYLLLRFAVEYVKATCSRKREYAFALPKTAAIQSLATEVLNNTASKKYKDDGTARITGTFDVRLLHETCSNQKK